MSEHEFEEFVDAVSLALHSADLPNGDDVEQTEVRSLDPDVLTARIVGVTRRGRMFSVRVDW